MRKLTLVIIAFFLAFSGNAQHHGFLFVHEENGTHSVGSYALESNDGSFFVSTEDLNVISPAKLLKLSANGELVKTVSLSAGYSRVAGLFADPDHADRYYAVCNRLKPETETVCPCIVHFNNDLDIISNTDVDIPGVYSYFESAKALLCSDGKVLFTTLINPSLFFRLHMRFTLSGELEQFVKEEGAYFPGSPFLFPDGSLWSYLNMNGENSIARYDDSLSLNMVNTYEELIHENTGDTTHAVSLYHCLYPTAIALPDSSFLIAEEAIESWYDAYGVPIGNDDESYVFFKSSYGGEVTRSILLGDKNIFERPAYYGAISSLNQNVVYLCGFQHLEPNSNGHYVMYNKIHVMKVNADLDVFWRKEYCLGSEHYSALNILATKDGGCLVTGGVVYDLNKERMGIFVLKINADGTVDTKEVMVIDERELGIFPNPVRDRLSFHYSPDVKPQHVALCDLQGRELRVWRSGFESLDLSGLSAGTYMLRVTLEGGKSYSDPVIKE